MKTILALLLVLALAGCSIDPPPGTITPHADMAIYAPSVHSLFPKAVLYQDASTRQFWIDTPQGREDLAVLVPGFWDVALARLAAASFPMPLLDPRTRVVVVFRNPECKDVNGAGHLLLRNYMPESVDAALRQAPESVCTNGEPAINGITRSAEGWPIGPSIDRALWVIYANAETPNVLEHEPVHLYTYFGGAPGWGMAGHGTPDDPLLASK